jgi:hypothetical protein
VADDFVAEHAVALVDLGVHDLVVGGRVKLASRTLSNFVSRKNSAPQQTQRYMPAS